MDDTLSPLNCEITPELIEESSEIATKLFSEHTPSEIVVILVYLVSGVFYTLTPGELNHYTNNVNVFSQNIHETFSEFSPLKQELN